MLKGILKLFAKYFAPVYISYLKPEIDRYVLNIQKKQFRNFGENIVFKGEGTIFHPENIVIEDNVQIGERYFFMGIGGIEIKEGTIISRDVCLHSGNHDFKNSEMIPYNQNYLKGKIIIGKGVWIGQNVNILPGVIIGDGAVIGMGTTVSKRVLPYQIVVGAGQRVVGERDKLSFEKALAEANFYAKYY